MRRIAGARRRGTCPGWLSAKSADEPSWWKTWWMRWSFAAEGYHTVPLDLRSPSMQVLESVLPSGRSRPRFAFSRPLQPLMVRATRPGLEHVFFNCSQTPQVHALPVGRVTLSAERAETTSRLPSPTPGAHRSPTLPLIFNLFRAGARPMLALWCGLAPPPPPPPHVSVGWSTARGLSRLQPLPNRALIHCQGQASTDSDDSF